ncbi:MAG: hypothetical protein AB4050_11205 [Synechococcus sp.]
MSFTLPANSYCPTASTPSLPWRPKVPLFFSATPIPHKAPFNLSACHCPTRSPQPSQDSEPLAAVSPASDQIPVATHIAVSPEPSSIAEPAPQAAAAIGVGALAVAGAVVSTGAGAIVDSPVTSQPVGSNSPEIPPSETDVLTEVSEAEALEKESPVRTKLSSPTPIPPHLLSPIPPSRPSVPASFLNEGNIDGPDSARESSMSVEEPLSPPSTARTDEDELNDIEGDYLDGAEELASVTSFGDIEPAPEVRVTAKTSEPGRETAFLDALEYRPVVVMGEVVDESVLNLPANANTSAALWEEDVAPSTSADAMALGKGPLTATTDSSASSVVPNPDRLGEPNPPGNSLGKFLGGFLVCFAIVGALIFLGVRVLPSIGPNNSDPLPESTIETE